MIRTIFTPLKARPAPRLFSVNQITLLSFFTGFPVGFAMTYVNLKRLGNSRGATQLVWNLAAASLVLFLLVAFLPVAPSVYSLPFNLLCIGYLTVVMNRELQVHQSRGGYHDAEKIWNGCGLGLLGLLAWSVLAGVLLILFYVAALVLNLPLPGLGI
ncbi:MAG: hypothetical protein HY869_15640 [Chloroflexi bacterium]|nr:hypothetical protein [Chloroflexota bacterium]